ncbi:hypothetical protein [Actinoplanes sp. NPDC026619]|uniref:hypothetical protein n=1 Tax=Actinoplanes sp. NPDC026619 TaxID=3155798 RepID=UPI0033DA68F3
MVPAVMSRLQDVRLWGEAPPGLLAAGARTALIAQLTRFAHPDLVGFATILVVPPAYMYVLRRVARSRSQRPAS